MLFGSCQLQSQSYEFIDGTCLDCNILPTSYTLGELSDSEKSVMKIVRKTNVTVFFQKTDKNILTIDSLKVNFIGLDCNGYVKFKSVGKILETEDSELKIAHIEMIQGRLESNLIGSSCHAKCELTHQRYEASLILQSR